VSRRGIYYWKCDRPAALHGTGSREGAAELQPALEVELSRFFDGAGVALRPGQGQGNHLTWLVEAGGLELFVRVENGPEGDGHLAVESAVLDRVRQAGVRTPVVHGCDASRSRVPFAWQALERVDAPDLNHWFKLGLLDGQRVAFDIGAAVARWQTIRPGGFGPLGEGLRGCHARYADYLQTRLDHHLGYLTEQGFLPAAEAGEMRREVDRHLPLLELAGGCLVHKDLALWNILGQANEIKAFIDFDDAIAGDEMDDLSLLGCFHDEAFVRRAVEGYESGAALPPEHRRRFWLHLLRNMIVKAVIRVGAGYFNRDSGFFLIHQGGGAGLRQATLDRLRLALKGLRADADWSLLSTGKG
jgi:fructosamine-3-kinase